MLTTGCRGRHSDRCGQRSARVDNSPVVLGFDSEQQSIIVVVCLLHNHVALYCQLVLVQTKAMVSTRGCLSVTGTKRIRLLGAFHFDHGKVLFDGPKLHLLAIAPRRHPELPLGCDQAEASPDCKLPCQV